MGFTTHTAEVTAARDWDSPCDTRAVVPSLTGSVERLFHDANLGAFYLDLSAPDLRRALREPQLERAIGVIYRPETERASHYFKARVSDQFDAIIHIDETTAVRALDIVTVTDEQEVPETYPSSL